MISKIKKVIKLFSLWIYSENKWSSLSELIRENAFSDRETINILKQNPKTGIIRYGNSELGLIIGNSTKTQVYDQKLKNKLIEICRNYNFLTDKKYLISLPLDNEKRLGVPSWYPGRGAKWAMRFLVKKNQKYSTHCFRIHEVVDDDMDGFVILLKSLFFDRDIIYIGPLAGKNPDVPDFIHPKETIKIPEKNAFEKTEQIINQTKNICNKYNDPLVVIVGGITACVVSYELNMSNITCYDFGQFDRLYKKYLQKKNN